ncbi:MAG: hypothetical protein ABR587_01155, partial [Candidatus Binatia bacterium]
MTMTMKKKLRLGLAALACAVAVAPSHAPAQVQDGDQKKCITGLNKAGAKVASTQGKADVGCVKNTGKGTETDATACLTADPKDKIAKAVAKVSTTFTKSCATLPDFGPDDATVASDGAVDETIGLATDVLGTDLTGTLLTSSSNADAAKCQYKVISTIQKLSNTIIKDFNSCKSKGLKLDSIDSAADLDACIETVNSDLKGKVAKGTEKVDDALGDTCAGLDLEALFPGVCASYNPIDDCIISRARCRACSVLSVMDGLGAVCDKFDDKLPGNESCGAPLIATQRTSVPSIETAETPGSPGVVVTNPKLLTQFPPSGPDLNSAEYVRWRLNGPEVTPDAVLILVPGFGSGVNPLRTLAEELIPKMLAEKNLRLEVWGRIAGRFSTMPRPTFRSSPTSLPTCSRTTSTPSSKRRCSRPPTSSSAATRREQDLPPATQPPISTWVQGSSPATPSCVVSSCSRAAAEPPR